MPTSAIAPEIVAAADAADAHLPATGPATATRRRARLRRRLLLLLVVPLLAVGLTACQPNSAQEQVRAAVNESRRASRLPELRDDWIVRSKAQAWADHLAQAGSLSHSKLSDGLGALPWTAVAENVGYGGSIAAVHDQFMRSSGHRANILDRRWDVMGAGHAVGRDGRVYVVHVFVALP